MHAVHMKLLGPANEKQQSTVWQWQSTATCGSYMNQFALYPHGTRVKSFQTKSLLSHFLHTHAASHISIWSLRGKGRSALRKAPESIASCRPLQKAHRHHFKHRAALEWHISNLSSHFPPLRFAPSLCPNLQSKLKVCLKSQLSSWKVSLEIFRRVSFYRNLYLAAYGPIWAVPETNDGPIYRLLLGLYP